MVKLRIATDTKQLAFDACLSIFLEIFRQYGEFTMARKKIQAVAYLRTRSAANVADERIRTADKRQRTAIAAYAKAAGVEIVETY